MATVEEQAYFLTVDWCNQDRRGIFCSTKGAAFRKDDKPHTHAEAREILGTFWVILSPESELLTEAQVAEYTRFTPLDEYSGAYGIARKAPAPATEAGA